MIMNNYKTALILVWSLFICQLNAQVDAYDISTYITPDFSYQALEVTPSLSFNKDLGGDKITTIFGDISYFQRSLSRKRISETIINSNFVYRKTSNENERIEEPTSNWSSRIRIRNNNQFYYKKKRFFSLNSSGFLSQGGGSTSDHFGYTSLSVSPGWGLGRAEIVTDAWHAKSIIQALQNKGLIKAEISKVQLEEFAQVITRIKNSRVIDFRFEDIYELEQLAAYLGDREYLDTDNFTFFATLNDAWLFEGFRSRKSGSTWQIGPVLNLETSLFDGNGQNNILSHYGIETRYNKYVAKGDFQIDYGAGVTIGKMNTTNNFWSVDANLDVAYLLSSRINLNAGIRASHRSYSDGFGDFTRGSFNFGMNYFVTPRLTLSGTGNVFLFKFSESDYRDTERFNLSMKYILR